MNRFEVRECTTDVTVPNTIHLPSSESRSGGYAGFDRVSVGAPF